jgi:hypothetical protein
MSPADRDRSLRTPSRTAGSLIPASPPRPVDSSLPIPCDYGTNKYITALDGVRLYVVTGRATQKIPLLLGNHLWFEPTPSVDPTIHRFHPCSARLYFSRTGRLEFRRCLIGFELPSIAAVVAAVVVVVVVAVVVAVLGTTNYTTHHIHIQSCCCITYS